MSVLLDFLVFRLVWVLQIHFIRNKLYHFLSFTLKKRKKSQVRYSLISFLIYRELKYVTFMLVTCVALPPRRSLKLCGSHLDF